MNTEKDEPFSKRTQIEISVNRDKCILKCQ